MDANATTPLLPEVFEAMRPWLLDRFGNASSTHQQGQRARAAVDHARDQVAALLHARVSEIVFTSGGTESDNLALFGVLKAGDHLVTSAIEHHAVLHAAEALEKRGVDVTYLPANAQGVVSAGDLEQAMRPNTRLVSVMLANNETGAVQPIAELAGAAKQHGALFHTDAVQAAGKMPLDLKLLRDVDLLSISGHKMYAPQGTGVLFVRRGVHLAPLFYGGSHERERRAGTENVAGIVALGEASEQAAKWLARGEAVTVAGLRDRLELALVEAIPASGVNAGDTPRTPNTINLYCDGVDADALLIALDLGGLALSAGSACQSGATEPSHVLRAMGLTPERAKASVRISLTRFATEQEVDRVSSLIPAAVARLRGTARTPSNFAGQPEAV